MESAYHHDILRHEHFTVSGLGDLDTADDRCPIFLPDRQDLRDASVDKNVEVRAKEGLCDVRRGGRDSVTLLNLQREISL